MVVPPFTTYKMYISQLMELTAIIRPIFDLTSTTGSPSGFWLCFSEATDCQATDQNGKRPWEVAVQSDKFGICNYFSCI